MRLAITNLGRLPSVDIDLSKDLILFTGPNNTTKTYVATVVYGVLRGEWLRDIKISEDDLAYRTLLPLRPGVAVPFPSAVLASAAEAAFLRCGAPISATGWIAEQFASEAAAFARTPDGARGGARGDPRAEGSPARAVAGAA